MLNTDKNAWIQSTIKEYTKEEQKISTDLSDYIFGYHIDPNNCMITEDSNIDTWITKNIVGKMLTLIDSVIDEKEKRDAIKSLARQLIEEERSNAIEYIYHTYTNNK